jgi:hypothetical protein
MIRAIRPAGQVAGRGFADGMDATIGSNRISRLDPKGTPNNKRVNRCTVFTSWLGQAP